MIAKDSVPRGTHCDWEGHAGQRPESRPNIRPRRLQQPKPARIGESWSSLLALQGRSREPAQCRQANPSPSVRDTGVGFRIPFARRFARVTARPQAAIDPIKIPPRWKNIESAPGCAHTFTKATSHGLRVRIWPKAANALPMTRPAKVLSLCFQSECNLDPEACNCKPVVLRAVLTILTRRQAFCGAS
jgi:hypothetical protein